MSVGVLDTPLVVKRIYLVKMRAGVRSVFYKDNPFIEVCFSKHPPAKGQKTLANFFKCFYTGFMNSKGKYILSENNKVI